MVVFEGNGIPALTPLPSQPLRNSVKRTMTDSVYITFRVAQLISSFRRRIKTRVLSHATSNNVSTAQLQDGLSDEFEDEVLEVVSKCRRQRRPTHRKRRNTRSEARKQPQVVGSSGLEKCFASVEDAEPPKDTHCSVEWLLAQLDTGLSPRGCPLLVLATDDNRLLSDRYEIDFDGGLHKAAELLTLTERLLDVIENTRVMSLAGGKLVCEGREVMFAESNFYSNLEHILLCLQNELLRFLLIDPALMRIFAHIIDCQREQSRRCDTWFSEFPDAIRPLSTTWPWSIRPSLVILWGVCWMFYYHWDSEGNLRSESGALLATKQEVEGFDLEPSIGTPQPPQANATDRPDATPTHQPHFGAFDQYYDAATITDHRLVPATERINITRPTTQPRDSYVATHGNVGNFYRPACEASRAIGRPRLATSIVSSNPSSNTGLGPWKQPGASPGSICSFPYPPFASMSTPFASPLSSQRQQRQQQSSSTTPNPFSPYKPMPDRIIGSSARTRETSLAPSEKDSFLSESPAGSSVKHEELDRKTTPSPSSLQPLRTRTRREPKLVAEDGKYACTTCHQAFERKCEWNKHMDKHERPYKCELSQCAKLLGFTYSGGLLRHEREVHNMHGGPKAQLYCPVRECKRHSSQGFTRKENLLEHLRRVHPSFPPEDAVSATTPVSRASEAPSEWSVVNPDSAAKRKRGSLSNGELQPQLPDDGVGREIKRLKNENGELRRKYEDQQQQLTGWRDEMTKMKQQIEQMLKLQQRDSGSGG